MYGFVLKFTQGDIKRGSWNPLSRGGLESHYKEWGWNLIIKRGLESHYQEKDWNPIIKRGVGIPLSRGGVGISLSRGGVGIPLSRGGMESHYKEEGLESHYQEGGWNPINRFNPATCLWRFPKAGTGFATSYVVLFLCSVAWGKRWLLVFFILVKLLSILFII